MKLSKKQLEEIRNSHFGSGFLILNEGSTVSIRRVNLGKNNKLYRNDKPFFPMNIGEGDNAVEVIA